MKSKNKAKNSKTTYIFTKETLGMTLLLFSAIVLIMLFAEGAPFSSIGKAICTFMFGTFGYGSFLLIALTAYLGVWLVFGKKIKISLKPALAISLTVFVLFLLFHSVTSRNISTADYGKYIAECYKNAANGYSGYTFGGVLSAVFVYPVAKLTTFVGAYVIFSLFVIACGYLLFKVFRRGFGNKPQEEPVSVAEESEAAVAEAEPVIVRSQHTPSVRSERRVIEPNVQQYKDNVAEQPQEDKDPYSKKNLGRKILFEKGEFDAESYRRNMIFYDNSYFNHPVNSATDYLNNFTSGKTSSVSEQTYAESYQQDILNQPAASAPSNYVYGDKPVEQLDGYEQVVGETYPVQETDAYDEDKNNVEEYTQALREEAIEVPKEEEKFDFGFRIRQNTEEEVKPAEKEEILPPISETKRRGRETSEEDDKPVHGDTVDMFKLFGSSNTARGNRIEPDVSRLSSRKTERSNANLFDDDETEKDDNFTSFTRSTKRTEQVEKQPEIIQDTVAESRTDNVSLPRRIAEERKSETVTNVKKTVQQPLTDTSKQEEKPKHVWKKYIRPGLDLLDDYPEHSNVNTGEIEDNKSTIVETLERFKIESEVSNVTIGPAITRYDVIIEDKTKIKQALNYKEAIAMALMKENVTAYLNYSKGALSIEVPNNARTVVGLKSMLSSQKFINCKSNSVTFALGKNVEGEVVCPDITKMPHLLVAGTTGSGKSICLSSLLISLLYKYGPEELRLILVDPKQVEFISYDRLPHLMINEIIYDVDKAIKALNWAIKEMERRDSLFKEKTEQGRATKNLDEYNAHIDADEDKLPKIVIILDEFGDLMLQAKKDIEGRIIKLVQKARACGIHLILATQRPSVDCITGLIKSNLPTRIGFKVNSFDDARTIFDIGGAEKLLGKGDLYFRSAESPELARIQGCFVDTHEVQKVTDFVKAHNETYFDQSVSDFINTVEVEETQNSLGGEDGAGDGGDIKIDDTYIKALHYCVTSNQASVSMIQRRFPVGYIKACKIIDWMENMNYVTQSEGSKPRKVLLSKEEFINTYGEIDD